MDFVAKIYIYICRGKHGFQRVYTRRVYTRGNNHCLLRVYILVGLSLAYGPKIYKVLSRWGLPLAISVGLSMDFVAKIYSNICRGDHDFQHVYTQRVYIHGHNHCLYMLIL